jgi:tRNA uridine 5-carbamoylmethylation protein Kti12
MVEILHERFLDMFLDHFAWDAENGVKAVVVLRGLPGCGKSTLARQLANEARSRGISVGICSADDYFVNALGEYRYNPLLLGTAHQDCRDRFDAMLASNPMDEGDPDAVSIIIVDNTNIDFREYDHYRMEALRRHDTFFTIRFVCDDEADAIRQGSRSVHRVPIPVVIRRYHLLQPDDDIELYPIYPEDW